MKIFAISDLHLSYDTNKPMDIFGAAWVGHWQDIEEDWRDKVSADDVVLIAGDISWAMRQADAKRDLEAIAKNPGTKIIIKGNHDYWWQSYAKLKDELGGMQCMVALQNNAVKIGGYIFCGTRGWTTPEPHQKQSDEDKKLCERELLRLNLTLSDAARLATNGEKIIALMHYPPFNSKFLPTPFTEAFAKAGVSCVVYGHLHGKFRLAPVVDVQGISYHLTSCDFLQNKLKLIEA